MVSEYGTLCHDGCPFLKLCIYVSKLVQLSRIIAQDNPHLLWAPAQRKRATMLYFANVFIYLFIFFMAALFSGPG